MKARLPQGMGGGSAEYAEYAQAGTEDAGKY